MESKRLKTPEFGNNPKNLHLHLDELKLLQIALFSILRLISFGKSDSKSF